MKRLFVLLVLLFFVFIYGTVGAKPLAGGLGEPVTEDQYNATKTRLDNYISSILQIPESIADGFYRRPWASPSYSLHPPGKGIRGTVLLFHGFTSRPHQMAVLEKYLFDNGFNVYNAGLPNHHLLPSAVRYYLPGEKHWPQVVLRKKYREPLLKIYDNQEKRQELLKHFSGEINADVLSGENVEKRLDLIQIFLDTNLPALNIDIREMMGAYQNPGGDAFKKYFTEGHLDYFNHAQARLSEVEKLPGPKYALGLSVGATVALGLAANNQDKIDAVVAYAPLLQVYGQQNRMRINVIGPSNRVMTENRGTHFNVSSFTATQVFGTKVQKLYDDNIAVSTPTFMVLTDSPWETAADIDVSRTFFDKIKQPGTNHFKFEYKPQHRVPHAFADPEEVSLGELDAVKGIAVSNEYWVSLYKETLRFFVDRDVVTDMLVVKAGDQDLPLPIDMRDRFISN